MTANNSLQRTVGHPDHTVLATDCVLAGAEVASAVDAERER